MSILKPFQFVSLAFMTQGVLLLNQIVLLPIQIRIWGTALTAYWFSTVAIAAVTSVADFGLRTAGHAELIRYTRDNNDLEAKVQFQHLWAWIRILICLVTSLLIIVDFGYNHFYLGAYYPLWRPALLISIAIEILVVVRVMYLDSLGFYREAEAGYLMLAAMRMLLALGALLIFRAPPSVLGFIWLFSALFGLVQQSWLCRRNGLLFLFNPIPKDLSFKTLAITRYTIADPCSLWARINGPVVVLSVIAAPAAITTYVAMRAVFGASRTTITQLSRYASVEYMALKHANRLDMAEIQLTACILLGAFFASGVATAVVVDNGRVASLLLNKLDATSYTEVAITFALGSAFACGQPISSIMLRVSQNDLIAKRQYRYMFYCAVFAIAALVTKSTLLWLSLMLLADILNALAYMLTTSHTEAIAQTSAGWRGCLAATASAILVLLMWLLMRIEDFDFLRERTFLAITYTVAFWLMWILLIAAVDVCLIWGLLTKNKNLAETLLQRLRGTRGGNLQNE